MNTEKHLSEHIKLHPSLRPQDVVKFCYQATRGPEHLIRDDSGAGEYLEAELSAVCAAPGSLFETLSDEYVRINLAAWKYEALPSEWLLRMFIVSAVECPEARCKLEKCLESVREMLPKMPFSEAEWSEYISEYKKQGMPPVRHSALYRNSESPAYRVVSARFVRILPILKHLAQKPEKAPFVIAIDGRSASGKSTAAADLESVLGCDTVHMDDFFLPPELRTTDRLGEAGGNVHYERFIEEVLPDINHRGDFSYIIFDCGEMDYVGKRHIRSTDVRIVEGSYSLHPLFGDYADLKVFSDISPVMQLERIRRRNGDEAAEVFKNKWIPFEERYFEAFSIPQSADLII